MQTIKPLLIPAAAAALGSRMGASIAAGIGDKPGSFQLLAGEVLGAMAGLYLAKRVFRA